MQDLTGVTALTRRLFSACSQSNTGGLGRILGPLLQRYESVLKCSRAVSKCKKLIGVIALTRRLFSSCLTQQHRWTGQDIGSLASVL